MDQDGGPGTAHASGRAWQRQYGYKVGRLFGQAHLVIYSIDMGLGKHYATERTLDVAVDSIPNSNHIIDVLQQDAAVNDIPCCTWN